MDYRHTEDFARRMEAAALQAEELRRQAAHEFWDAVFAGIGRGLRAVQCRLSGAARSKKLMPEA